MNRKNIEDVLLGIMAETANKYGGSIGDELEPEEITDITSPALQQLKELVMQALPEMRKLHPDDISFEEDIEWNAAIHTAHTNLDQLFSKERK